MVAVMVEGFPLSSCCRWRMNPQANLSIALDDSLCLRAHQVPCTRIYCKSDAKPYVLVPIQLSMCRPWLAHAWGVVLHAVPHCRA